MITGPNNTNASTAKSIASTAVDKYSTESKAGKSSSAQVSSTTTAPQENTAVQTTSSASDVSLSKEAKMLQKLSQEISSYPSVDAERVEAIKREVASGGFKINSASIAQKMMLLDSLY